MRYFFTLIFFSISALTFAQNKNSTNDTTLAKILTRLPKEEHKKFTKRYKKMSDEEKMFVEIMVSLPISSKKELIENLHTNHANILAAKDLCRELVPAGYKIYIEFTSPNKSDEKERVDLWAWKTDSIGNEKNIFRDWKLPLHSKTLDSLLTVIQWDYDKLEQVKAALTNAHCISIQNGNPTEIGFARSGMGKYSYVIFDTNLTEEQSKEFKDGCEYIFYKDNIVLMYKGGAMGPQCFPDRD